MTRKLRKAVKFTFRMTLEQKKLLEKIADKQGKKPSDLVRDVLLHEIGRQAVSA